MKRFFAFAMLGCVLLVAACTKPGTGGAGEVKYSSSRDVVFTTDINHFNVKATDTAFENGDEIGLFAGAPISKNNVKGTVAGTTVNVDEANPIKWMAEQTAATDFIGYYPYDAALTDASAYAFAVATDQTAEGAYAASDLMVANTTANPPASETDQAIVNLNFKHVLSKVIIKIDNQLAKTISGVSFLAVANSATFDLSNAGASSAVGAVQPMIKAVKGVDDGTKTVYQLLIVPQSAQPQIKIDVAEGESYVYSLASAFTFAKGKKYTAEVAITEEAVAGAVNFTLEVTDWEDADENPVFGGQEVTVVKDKWSVIGKIMGANWNKDFVMTDNQDNSWSIDITYGEGDEFKFRFNGEWTYQYGMWNSDPNEMITLDAILATTSENKTYGLADNSEGKEAKNIKLPANGDYTLTLFTYGDNAGDLYVTKK